MGCKPHGYGLSIFKYGVQMNIQIQSMGYTNSYFRLIIKDGNGGITDIIEGSFRYVMEELLKMGDASGELKIRKVKRKTK